MQINADDLMQWYRAQELVYASATRGNYSVRLTVLKLGDYPAYMVVRRHIHTLKRKELYYGTTVDVAVRIFNEATGASKPQK